jgi:hypothetical protein
MKWVRFNHLLLVIFRPELGWNIISKLPIYVEIFFGNLPMNFFIANLIKKSLPYNKVEAISMQLRAGHESQGILGVNLRKMTHFLTFHLPDRPY